MKRLTTMRTLKCPCCEAEILVDVTHYVKESWKDGHSEPYTIIHVEPIRKENTPWMKKTS